MVLWHEMTVNIWEKCKKSSETIHKYMTVFYSFYEESRFAETFPFLLQRYFFFWLVIDEIFSPFFFAIRCIVEVLKGIIKKFFSLSSCFFILKSSHFVT